jgi:2-polyprenyl-6-methoxyphenol hydroxylase-like FAD-dependent oxidoreductase
VSRRSPHVTVLGAGPVGLITALKFALSGRAVTLIAEHFPCFDRQLRVDAVPAALIALLSGLGISSRSIGADRVDDRRRIAWECDRLRTTASRRTVYLERQMLELAVFEALQRNRLVRFEQRRLSKQDMSAYGHTAGECLIDATGRAAVSATVRIRPPKPWIARTFWAPRSYRRSNSTFAITSLPDGYAYRAYSATYVTIGVVGRGNAVAGSADEITQYLRAYAVELFEDGPVLQDMFANRARAASVQWAEDGAKLCIGDAALARDALSSQGIATGASEALLAWASSSEQDLNLIRTRSRQQRGAHLRALLNIIDDCKYAARPAWQEYRAFVAAQPQGSAADVTSALRDGRIEQVAL